MLFRVRRAQAESESGAEEKNWLGGDSDYLMIDIAAFLSDSHGCQCAAPLFKSRFFRASGLEPANLKLSR